MIWRNRLASATAIFLLAPATSFAAAPTAFELLQRVRSAYEDLNTYHDLGEIETTFTRGGVEKATVRFFETAVEVGGRFQWRTHGEAEDGFEERLVWTDGRDSFVYSSRFQQYKPIPSLVGELAHILGPGGYEALVVPLLLAGSDDVLEDPEAAAIDGLEDCGDASCWVLTLSRMGGAIESELRIDRSTSLIREVVVRLSGPGPPTAETTRMTLTVRHHPAAVATAPFEAPAVARRVTEWERTAPSTDDDPWLDIGLQEEITVALFTITARIVDGRGQPVLDLRPQDLIVRVGKTEVPIQSLEWSSSYRPAVEIPQQDLAEARAQARAGRLTMALDPVEPEGKLVVLFLQIDLHPSRVKGHLKILPDVEELLGSLHPDDRVAIVSFDSHLKLWQDFTRDRGAAFETLTSAIGYGKPLARRSRGLSLAEHFDFHAADDAASPEKALQLTAEALAPLPGDKDLIYLGWGLGRFGAGGVRMTPDYAPAVRALDQARATVFVLDVSQADYHSLEIGLQNVAAHTGGSYERTFHFASQAVRRLARTIGGHYRLTIDRSDLPAATGRLNISLREREGRVLFKPMILG